MSRNHIVKDIMSTLRNLPPFSTNSCIFKVPYTLRHVNQEAYKPLRLSIGPFHHGKKNLLEMEVHKHRYLKDFFGRRPDLKLEEYIEKLEKLQDKVRNCYAEKINCNNTNFIKMMLLDGCFIVEFFLKFSYPWLRSKDDTIFMSETILNELGRDILLLENELPFFVFECLFNLNARGRFQEVHSFLHLTVDVMVDLGGHLKELKSLRNSNYQGKHFLDLYLKCYAPKETTLLPKPVREFINIPSATRLHDAGIRFRKSTESAVNCFLDVKFHDGIFQIPTLILDDDTESLFRNLVAFEQFDAPGKTRYMTDYIFLLDCLIDAPSDVALLREAGIINNYLGDDKEVSQLVNKFRSGVANNSDVYYGGLCENVNVYYSNRWPAWRAKLQRDYFGNPWSIISAIGAVILLILAFIQTICSVIQL